MAVGQNIRKWRERRSYSQTELARLAGISANSLYRIEKESYTPRPQTVRKIAEILGLDAETLLDGATIAEETEPVEVLETKEETPFLPPEQAETNAIIVEPPSMEIGQVEHNPVLASDEKVLYNVSLKPSFLGKRKNLLAFLFMLGIIIAMLVWNFTQQNQLQSLEWNQAQYQRGLDLLTNTEIINNRLNPVEAPTSQAHGHWFHENGNNTQVFVIEFMALLPPDQSYYAWAQLGDGSWHSVCRFWPDDKGYARNIVDGSDGSNIRAVIVTRQSEIGTKPGGTTVLRYPT